MEERHCSARHDDIAAPQDMRCLHYTPFENPVNPVTTSWTCFPFLLSARYIDLMGRFFLNTLCV